MKKKYIKPQIMFEDFTLTTNIAGDCDTIITNSSRDQCPYVLRTGKFVFLDGISGCTTIEDDGNYNGVCYHVPIDDKNLFNS